MILLQLLYLFQSSFVRKKIFYSENFPYVYISMGLDCKCMQRHIWNPVEHQCCKASLRKLQKSFILNVWPCSRYTSGVGFTVENVSKMLIFVWYYQSLFQKIVVAFLFLEFIKTSWFNEEDIICSQAFRCCRRVT